MEEGALAVARFLAVLDLPLGLVAIVVGLLTAIVQIPRASLASLPDVGRIERIAVGLGGGVAMLGLIGAVETVLFRGRPDFSLVAMVFVASVALCGLPAVVWRSRWRGAAEGVATVAVALVAILSGFTIGFMFVPLVALMLWVCFLRLFHAFRAMRGIPPTRVDSLT
jgi:hypothetical protein